MKTILMTLITLFTMTSTAEVIETQNYRDILSTITAIDAAKTLFVSDLDNTIMRPKQTLGSDEWGEYMLKKIQTAGFTKEDAVKMQVSFFSTVNQKTEVTTVERDTQNIINQLQKMHITTIGLTARPLYLADRTIDLLKSIQVQFDQNCLNSSDLNDTTVNCQNGVFFVGPFNNKGLILKRLLELPENKKYKKIIFIDDKPHHALNVDVAMKELGLSIRSYRYGAADILVKNFNPLIVDNQWDVFQKTGTLISDQEAEKLIK